MIFGANAIQPVIAAEEVATRIAHGRVILLTQSGQYIAPKAVFISVRRGRIINAFVDTASHMFGKAAKEKRRDFADRAIIVDIDFCRMVCHNKCKPLKIICFVWKAFRVRRCNKFNSVFVNLYIAHTASLTDRQSPQSRARVGRGDCFSHRPLACGTG